MPIPSTIDDLSTSAASNSPLGSENPGVIDDYLRAIQSVIKQESNYLRDESASLSNDLNTLSEQLGGFKNKVINSNFAINQRDVSGTVTLAAGAYGHDRWKAGSSGCTYTFATVNNVTTLTITAGTLVQVIEGLNLQSGTHILTWTGTAQGRIGSGAYGASGVTGTAVGGTNQSIEFSTGTISKVQYEEGSIATPFEHRPIGLELALCLRYYERLKRAVYVSMRGTGDANPTAHIWFKEVKRVIPTISNLTSTLGTPTVIHNNVDGFSVDVTAGFAAISNWTASAEL